MATNKNTRNVTAAPAPAPAETVETTTPVVTQEGTADGAAEQQPVEQTTGTEASTGEQTLPPETSTEETGTGEKAQESNTEENIPTPVAQQVLATPSLAPAVVQKENTGSATQVTLESVIEKIKLNGDAVSMSTVFNLESYIEKMQPGKPVEKAEIVASQVALWKTLSTFIEKSQTNFRQTYSVVLALFEKHKDGVFNERYVFRMMSDVPLPADDLFAFQALINLIKVTAPVQGRVTALKQNVDMSRTLSKVFSEQARQKLLDFYGM
jgi:hypothetical protein